MPGLAKANPTLSKEIDMSKLKLSTKIVISKKYFFNLSKKHACAQLSQVNMNKTQILSKHLTFIKQ